MSVETIESILEILKKCSWPAIIIVVVVIVLYHPEKVEKWSSLIWRVIYWAFKRGGKRIVAHDIQGRVNEYSRSLAKEIKNYDPVGIKIEWVKEDEEAKSFFKENRLVIRLRHHEDQNKNLVHATMILISKSFLPKTKKYLSPTQNESVDLYVGKKLFEKERPHVVDKFFNEYFLPKALSNQRIIELIEKYEIINKVGLFYGILVQELTFLGEKVFFQPKRQEITAEVTNFINFLEQYAQRDIGEARHRPDFEGKYCRCAIVIVAKGFKRKTGKIDPYVHYIGTLIAKELENIYILGPAGQENREFIDHLSDLVKTNFKYEKFFAKRYKAKIKVHGERKDVRNYLVLLRSPDAKRYYDKEYQDKFIEPTGR